MESLGIIGFDSIHFAVENLERSKKFYLDKLDFDQIAHSGDLLAQRSGQSSTVFGAGDVRVCVSTPLNQNCRAARYLRRHPAGIMSLSFRVADLDRTLRVLESRGATILADPLEDRHSSGGRYRSFEIATPLGDVAFRYVERTDYGTFGPGFEQTVAKPKPNKFGIELIDHVTANALTMAPLILFYKEVLGMQEFWRINFHTADFAKESQAKKGNGGAKSEAHGTGLKSIVMWDPEGDIKFASNEPLRPFFRESQIARFCDDNGGPGIQHLAMRLPAIVPAVRELNQRGLQFLPTHKSYYRYMPDRLAKLKITNVKENVKDLEELEILVDGENDKYMLQIFMREAASLYRDDRAGPFFYELIQRAGDEGFGYGNFRALFESIEREQDSQNAANSPPG
jgi:4-hydroxyphenylpyruvate dioxygenase